MGGRGSGSRLYDKQLQAPPEGYGGMESGFRKNLIPLASDSIIKKGRALEVQLYNERKLDEYNAPVRSINIAQLKTIQPVIVGPYIENPQADHASSTKYPFVAKIDNQYIVLDGNHRIARAIYTGKKRIKAYVYE